MSRIGDALKRSGTPVIADGLMDMPLSVTLPEPSAAGPAVLSPEPAPAAAPSPDGSVPTLNGVTIHPSSHLVVNQDLPVLAIEQYRRLAAVLHHVQEDRGIKRVLVSSAVASEGKTLTSTNLALTLSQSYARRVLLIDADLRRPRVNVLFGIRNGDGLSEVLHRREPRTLPVVQVSPTLSVLPAGRATPDPIAGLTSPRMAAILNEAAEQFDWVIVDTPPVGLLSDARLLASMTDVSLLVIGAGTTPCEAIARAMDAIGRDRVLGVVLNRADDALAAAGDYYSYYGYYGNSDHRNGRNGILRRLFGRR